jgi:uncharacterized protein
MLEDNNIIQSIKSSILSVEPDATIIVYGSYARGNNTSDSDIDILILLDKEKIRHEDEKNITNPLYDIELESGILISPILYSKKYWLKQHKATPFYENVNREGVVL